MVSSIRLLVCAALFLGMVSAGQPPAFAAGEPSRHILPVGPVVYDRPVDGGVLRSFDPPVTAFGSGHRGVDLAAPAGTSVRAAADGVVAFVGQVGEGRWVAIEHGDGVRTSYGELGTIEVAVGDLVTRGATLGTVDGAPHGGGLPALHWGARRGTTYVDPLALLGVFRASLVGPGGWRVGDRPDLPGYAAWDGRHRFGIVPRSRVADGPGWSLPPNPNHVLGVAGLGSRTGEPPFDLTHLGYDPRDVSYLSYAPDGGAYGPEHTWAGVDAAARRLQEDLRERWATSPGQAVDLVGHSMGGVVALYYLLRHHDPTDPTLPPIGNVVTVASPVGGADLASAFSDAADHPVGRQALDAIGRLVGDHDPTSQAIRDLAVGSSVLSELGTSWSLARGDLHAGPLATGTRILTLGADLDPVVPEHRSDLDGAPHAVLPGTHDGVRRTEAVRIAVRTFLAGGPVTGEPGGLGHWSSYPVGWLERWLVDALLPG